MNYQNYMIYDNFDLLTMKQKTPQESLSCCLECFKVETFHRFNCGWPFNFKNVLKNKNNLTSKNIIEIMANIIFSFPDLVTWITRITWFMITLTTLQCLREKNSQIQTVTKVNIGFQIENTLKDFFRRPKILTIKQKTPQESLSCCLECFKVETFHRFNCVITLTTLQCLRETNSHIQTVKYIEYCKKQTWLKFYYYQIVFAE
jgi:hypothetical protein